MDNSLRRSKRVRIPTRTFAVDGDDHSKQSSSSSDHDEDRSCPPPLKSKRQIMSYQGKQLASRRSKDSEINLWPTDNTETVVYLVRCCSGGKMEAVQLDQQALLVKEVDSDGLVLTTTVSEYIDGNDKVSLHQLGLISDKSKAENDQLGEMEETYESWPEAEGNLIESEDYQQPHPSVVIVENDPDSSFRTTKTRMRRPPGDRQQGRKMNGANSNRSDKHSANCAVPSLDEFERSVRKDRQICWLACDNGSVAKCAREKESSGVLDRALLLHLCAQHPRLVSGCVSTALPLGVTSAAYALNVHSLRSPFERPHGLWHTCGERKQSVDYGYRLSADGSRLQQVARLDCIGNKKLSKLHMHFVVRMLVDKLLVHATQPSVTRHTFRYINAEQYVQSFSTGSSVWPLMLVCLSANPETNAPTSPPITSSQSEGSACSTANTTREQQQLVRVSSALCVQPVDHVTQIKWLCVGRVLHRDEAALHLCYAAHSTAHQNTLCTTVKPVNLPKNVASGSYMLRLLNMSGDTSQAVHIDAYNYLGAQLDNAVVVDVLRQTVRLDTVLSAVQSIDFHVVVRVYSQTHASFPTQLTKTWYEYYNRQQYLQLSAHHNQQSVRAECALFVLVEWAWQTAVLHHPSAEAIAKATTAQSNANAVLDPLSDPAVLEKQLTQAVTAPALTYPFCVPDAMDCLCEMHGALFIRAPNSMNMDSAAYYMLVACSDASLVSALVPSRLPVGWSHAAYIVAAHVEDMALSERGCQSYRLLKDAYGAWVSLPFTPVFGYSIDESTGGISRTHRLDKVRDDSKVASLPFDLVVRWRLRQNRTVPRLFREHYSFGLRQTYVDFRHKTSVKPYLFEMVAYRWMHGPPIEFQPMIVRRQSARMVEHSALVDSVLTNDSLDMQ